MIREIDELKAIHCE